MKIPFDKIVEKAKFYEKDITKFLRDMIAIPSESCEEKKVIERIKQEMFKVGFDHVSIDPMGVKSRIGSLILILGLKMKS